MKTESKIVEIQTEGGVYRIGDAYSYQRSGKMILTYIAEIKESEDKKSLSLIMENKALLVLFRTNTNAIYG